MKQAREEVTCVTSFKLWVVDDGSATATADNLGSESGVLSQNKSGTFPLQSRMCEVAVFTAGLSPARIAAHYAASGL